MAMNAGACVKDLMGAWCQLERWAWVSFHWRGQIRGRAG